MSLRICVIGCGSIANAMHGPSYLKYADVNREAVFAGCCDVIAERAADFKSRFGFANAYTDMDEMITREKPDAVCLISPVFMTAELAGKILDMRIPLLLEKPPGRTTEETMRLINIAERNKTPNRVAFNRRYAPLVRTLKGMLDEGYTPDQIQSLQYDMFRVNRLDEDFSTTAIHAIDAVRFIMGSDYESICFFYREYPQYGNNVADIHMQCKMKSGAAANLNICPVTGLNVERAVVNLYNNTFFLDYLGNEMYAAGRLVKTEGNHITFSLDGDHTPDGTQPFEREGFYYENMSFFNDIMNGRTPSGDLGTALQSVEVAQCIRDRQREYISL